MNSQPLVSIGLINYNNERFVIEALEGVKSQTYDNTELIIVDDCSTDRSLILIKEWLSTYKKPYTLIEHPENMGVSAGAADVIRLAAGEYLALAATDDIMLPDKTADQVALLEKHGEEYALVYGDIEEIDENSIAVTYNKYTIQGWRNKDFDPPSGYIFREVLKGIFFYLQASLINLPLLRKTGFQYDSRVMPDDYDLELTLSRNYKILGTKNIYTKYRVTDTSFSNTYLKKKNLHTLYKSLIYMLMKYLKHPLNSAEDKAAIMERAKEIYWYLKRTPAFNRKDQVIYDALFLTKTRTPGDLFSLLKSTAGYLIGAKQFKPAENEPAS